MELWRQHLEAAHAMTDRLKRIAGAQDAEPEAGTFAA